MMLKPRRHILDLTTTALASFLATAVDGILYVQLLEYLVRHGLYYDVGMAASLGAILGGITHFVLCRYWVFQRYDKPLWESIATYALMSGGAVLVHGFATHIFAAYAGPWWGWTFSKGLIFLLWTYPMSRFIVFGRVSEEMNS